MNENINLVISLLSTGVLTALVTGAFALIVAIKNNKRLVDIEKNKQNFSIKQERYKNLLECYNILLDKLPQSEHTSNYIMNSHLQLNRDEVDISSIWTLSEKNGKFIFEHYNKYKHLFLANFCSQIDSLIEKSDCISRQIIQFQLQNGYVNDVEEIIGLQKERLVAICELEIEYPKGIQVMLSSYIEA